MKNNTNRMQQFRVVLWLLMGGILLIGNQVFAQEDIMEDQDSVDCKPANITAPTAELKEEGLEPQQINIWYSLASENFKNKQYNKAIPYYWKVIANAPDGKIQRFSYNKLSESYIEVGKGTEDTRAYLDSTLFVVYEGLEKYPAYSTLHYRAGTLHRSLGNSTCAIPHYQELVKKHPKEANYYQVLTELLMDGNDERAIEVQEKLVELDPSVANQNKLRMILESFGKDPMQAIIGAFERDTTSVKNANALVKEALMVGNYPLALRAANAALKTEPTNIKALDGQAKAYESLGDYNKAIASYRRITDAEPKNINAFCSLALAYASVKNFSAARSQANRAKSIDRNNGLPYMILGQIYEEAVDYCSAKRGKNEYNYDDNLVFEIAGAEYARAKRDANRAAQATSRINALRPFYRSTEQKFLRQNSTTIKDGCYSWIR